MLGRSNKAVGEHVLSDEQHQSGELPAWQSGLEQVEVGAQTVAVVVRAAALRGVIGPPVGEGIVELHRAANLYVHGCCGVGGLYGHQDGGADVADDSFVCRLQRRCCLLQELRLRRQLLEELVSLTAQLVDDERRGLMHERWGDLRGGGIDSVVYEPTGLIALHARPQVHARGRAWCDRGRAWCGVVLHLLLALLLQFVFLLASTNCLRSTVPPAQALSGQGSNHLVVVCGKVFIVEKMITTLLTRWCPCCFALWYARGEVLAGRKGVFAVGC